MEQATELPLRTAPPPPRFAAPAWRRANLLLWLALVALCLGWELWWAPLRPGGSWLMLKVLPLLAAARVLEGLAGA